MKEEVIKEHHINDELIFWPDIAFCHYAKQTIERLQIENIPCLSKGAILLMFLWKDLSKNFELYSVVYDPG